MANDKIQFNIDEYLELLKKLKKFRKITYEKGFDEVEFIKNDIFITVLRDDNCRILKDYIVKIFINDYNMTLEESLNLLNGVK